MTKRQSLACSRAYLADQVRVQDGLHVHPVRGKTPFICRLLVVPRCQQAGEASAPLRSPPPRKAAKLASSASTKFATLTGADVVVSLPVIKMVSGLFVVTWVSHGNLLPVRGHIASKFSTKRCEGSLCTSAHSRSYSSFPPLWRLVGVHRSDLQPAPSARFLCLYPTPRHATFRCRLHARNMPDSAAAAPSSATSSVLPCFSLP